MAEPFEPVPPGEVPPFEGASPPPPDPRRRDRRRWRIAAVLLALFLILIAWLAVTAPLSRSLQPIAAPGITLLSANGTPIARRGAVIDKPVDVADLPDHVPQAFLAIEDRRFYNHMGVDPWGIMRAAIKNVVSGGVVEGGSTISQQLAKLAFLSSDRTYGRKAQEFIMAFWLEAWLSKDEILSRYMSGAYFGDNVYGLRAASKHYFSKNPEDLSIEQAAMLAGLVKAPSRLAPTSNLKGARARSKVVIDAMVDAGVLSEAQADDLPPVTLKRGPIKDLPTGTYFADWVFPQARDYAEGVYGEQTIQTTLEDDIQRQAVAAIRRANLGKAQVALVAMRPDGRVVAMVGGKSYRQSPFNRATQAKRQPGSAFKLFVYLTALRRGLTPDSIVLDAPLSINDWTPKNSDGVYRGPITLRDALAVSSNVAAVRLSERVGRDNVIQTARDLGVTSELHSHPSLALGTSGMSLLELTAAYAAIADGRYPVKPRGIPETEEGGWFSSFMDGPSRLGRRIQTMMLDMLWQVANAGTGRAAALNVETFGKTGTTQDNRDALFVGFAGDLVTAVWIGNDDNSPLRGNTSGGGLPAQIWRDFMSGAVKGGTPVRRAAPQPRAAEPQQPVGERPTGMTIPVEGTDYQVGVDVGRDSVTISAEPRPRPADRPVPDQTPILPPTPQPQPQTQTTQPREEPRAGN
ncbi:MAG TPA: PBP1A family penicillin-binding protein [Allosphingosinicella sp.]|nr:PBP1A family penicillin-binding protein [Allosphingosinicella sp.]